MKTTSNPALEREALYAKSQVYIRRGLRAQATKEAEEFQLWASLALELLGKAALAKVHPSLVADPTHYQSLFAACGRHISTDLKTITAKTVFERLRHLEKEFDSRHQDFCVQMSLRRNAELHSGESPFSGMGPDLWEREFWGCSELVLRMQDETLESWLGVEDSKAPHKLIEQAEKALVRVVENRLRRYKEDFENKFKNPAQRKKAVTESKNLSSRDFSFNGQIRERCPSCTSWGFLRGTLWGEEVIDTDDGDHWEEPDGEVCWTPPRETVGKSFTAEKFDCPVCSLVLNGSREILAADLSDEFTLEETREREFEPDYGND